MTRKATWAVLALGVVSCSTSAVMVRLTQMPAAWLSAARLLVAVAALFPLWLAAVRRHPETAARYARSSVMPAIFLARPFITWIYGVQLTSVVRATVIVNLAPVAMPFFMYGMLRDPLRPGEWAGVALALAGAAILGVTDARDAPDSLRGDLICFVSMLLFAAYLAVGRRNRHAPSPWLYIVPLYAVAAVVCLPFAAWAPSWQTGWRPVSGTLVAVGLGLIPTVLGHSSLMAALRTLSPQTVTMANLGAFISAGLLAFLAFGEIPAPSFYPACALMVGGAVCAIRSAARDGKGMNEPSIFESA